jgi:hypothetical protein
MANLGDGVVGGMPVAVYGAAPETADGGAVPETVAMNLLGGHSAAADAPRPGTDEMAEALAALRRSASSALSPAEANELREHAIGLALRAHDEDRAALVYLAWGLSAHMSFLLSVDPPETDLAELIRALRDLADVFEGVASSRGALFDPRDIAMLCSLLAAMTSEAQSAHWPEAWALSVIHLLRRLALAGERVAPRFVGRLLFADAQRADELDRTLVQFFLDCGS